MKNKKYFRVFLLLFVFLFFTAAFLSGCAEMEPDTIHNLKVQVKKLNKKTDKLSQSNAYLEQKIHEIQLHLANQGAHIAGLDSKIKDVYGKYEVESHNLHMLQKRFRQYRLIVNKELIKLLKHAQIKPPVKEITPSKKAVVSVSPKLKGFNKGMDLYKKKDYANAVLAFNKFISKYPQSKDTPDAVFYKAVSNFNLKKYPVSILEFHKFSEVYPKSSHVPMAIYLQGMGFLKLSDKSDASILFQQVVSKYPDTEASKLSAAELKKLSK
ncbi:MAG: tetratricopeptide repeat protein [Deltaproteobacteria bacterium]|jgi:tol-pal system protein YbgF|nr:tetratricopeptide repeat protein [Deltaproteobacteria bacterium]MCL5880762.1 tetratricopeptide repeat protein [Deltaproteobacteria bacterium]MDA8304228.1 tetratricopeptide repeat protein [Deltaproteobacteria bacterium]